MEFIVALLSIMMVNIVLSGDNAVVIAMASRRLPPKHQKRAILWGSAGAIGLRVILTLVAVVLLTIPYLQGIGGAFLIWIAIKLLVEPEHTENIEASCSFGGAIKTIIMADLVMSLDNTLAIAAVAKGNILLLIIGLALSIPIIVLGSKLIIVLMDKYPIIVYGGAALIAWTAGEMIINDQKMGVSLLYYLPYWALPLIITIGVISVGVWHTRYRQLSHSLEKVTTKAH